jgi:hypothetical protein
MDKVVDVVERKDYEMIGAYWIGMPPASCVTSGNAEEEPLVCFQ